MFNVYIKKGETVANIKQKLETLTNIDRRSLDLATEKVILENYMLAMKIDSYPNKRLLLFKEKEFFIDVTDDIRETRRYWIKMSDNILELKKIIRKKFIAIENLKLKKKNRYMLLTDNKATFEECSIVVPTRLILETE